MRFLILAVALTYSITALGAAKIQNENIKANAAIDATKISDGSVSNAEFQFINSLTSNAQTQLNGKVSSLSIATANGFSGSSSGGTTPALTIGTTITGLLKGDGTAISAATAGTDYLSVLTGDVTTSGNTATLANTGVGAGSCTNCNLTYDAKGRITVAANGSGGGSGSAKVARFNCSRPYADASTTLLLKFDEVASAYDYSTNRYAATSNNSASSGDTGQIKFGAGSFDQSSTENWQYTGPGNLGSGDFTVEFWAYNTNWTNNLGIAGTKDAGSNYWQIMAVTGGIRWQSGPAGGAIKTVTAGLPSNNAWHHIAFVRSSGTITAYVDGTASGTPASDGSNYSDSQLRIGASTTDANNFQGFIDEFRISNTARYTANFTPSATAFSVAPQITYNPSSWISSITSSIASPGACQPQFTGGTFTSAPVCTITPTNASTATAWEISTSTTSAGSFKTTVSGSAADTFVNLSCQE